VTGISITKGERKMKKVNLLKKSGVVGIIVIFICASFVPSIGGYSEDTTILVDTDIEDVWDSQENVLVTCSAFGFPGEPSQEITMSLDEAKFLYDKIKELQIETARDPLSDKTLQLQHEIIILADGHNLLPASLSVETLKSRLTSTLRPQHPRITLPRLQNRASEMFCNYVSTGSGTSLPIIILPRLIPILLTPIPRLFVRWKTSEGITSCGGLRSGTGFIATGAQNGIALGFWGIGFSIFLPPVMAYGLFGYALYASVNAEEIELWPPNNPPVISNENPPSGTWNVPVSLSELSFQIEDADSDPMSYSVTTSPDIGSGSGTNKGDGVYTVPVSGLKSNTQYQWVVEVADGEDVTVQEFSFITEELPFDPFDEGWQYRKKITIDHTQVVGDLNYFPVLVSTLDTNLRDKAQDDGDDMLFMNGPGVANKLYHEIEHYDGSSGEMVAWVNIPSVSHDEDTVLYMYYGNPGCSSQQVPERVWDNYYCGVWHLDELSGLTYDSTGYNNNGQAYGATYNTPGQINGAYDFEADDPDRIEVPHSSSLAITSGWIKAESYKFKGTILTKYACYYTNLAKDGRIDIYTYWNNGGNRGTSTHLFSNTILTTETWYHFAWTESTTGERKIYINGVLDSSGPFESSIWSQSDELEIGQQTIFNNSKKFDGILDELRVSNIARDDDWIKTSYTNQNDPTSFLSFGPEETGP